MAGRKKVDFDHLYESKRRSKVGCALSNGIATLKKRGDRHGKTLGIWQFEGAIERTLPEIFAPEYKELIDAWKRKLCETR